MSAFKNPELFHVFRMEGKKKIEAIAYCLPYTLARWKRDVAKTQPGLSPKTWFKIESEFEKEGVESAEPVKKKSALSKEKTPQLSLKL